MFYSPPFLLLISELEVFQIHCHAVIQPVGTVAVEEPAATKESGHHQLLPGGSTYPYSHLCSVCCLSGRT